MKSWRTYAIVAICAAIGMGALLLLAKSAQHSSEFSRLQPWILLFNLIGVLGLTVLLVGKLGQLVRDYRNHVPGSRLTARTVSIFGALVVAPLVIVYLFSLEFLNRGIDSWFKAEVKESINEALTLSRSAFDVRMREYAGRTERFARSLEHLPPAQILERLNYESRTTDAVEIAIFGQHEHLIAISGDGAAGTDSASTRPPPDLVRQVRQNRTYVSLEPRADGRYIIRTAAPLSATDSMAPASAGGVLSTSDGRYVVASYEVPPQLAALSEAVQRAYSQYGDLAALREPLKYSFRLTLTLVLLLAMLGAIHGAIFFAQRLVRPVQDLIAGTRAVGKGDFDTHLPLPSRDEMGFLVHSFNDMTKRLRRAHEEAQRSQQALLQAQRDAAWGEVARRLAHEIKNPLTPIQLSAERLQRRFRNSLNPADAEVLERATHTIVQQVEAMKQMVNAFSDYARAPALSVASFPLNPLVAEVADLYRAHDSRTEIHLDLDERVGEITADRGRVRQILNNLITNALEALESQGQAAAAQAAAQRVALPGTATGHSGVDLPQLPQVQILTRLEHSADMAYAALTVCDNGPGFQSEMLKSVFDPYVTSKPRGTGLGLAIVKKIVEEHGGSIHADNRPEGGARVRVMLPAALPKERRA